VGEGEVFRGGDVKDQASLFAVGSEAPKSTVVVERVGAGMGKWV